MKRRGRCLTGCTHLELLLLLVGRQALQALPELHLPLRLAAPRAGARKVASCQQIVVRVLHRRSMCGSHCCAAILTQKKTRH